MFSVALHQFSLVFKDFQGLFFCVGFDNFCIAEMTAVGFEPTPLRNGALSYRLRPLGQTVLTSTWWSGLLEKGENNIIHELLSRGEKSQ